TCDAIPRSFERRIVPCPASEIVNESGRFGLRQRHFGARSANRRAAHPSTMASYAFQNLKAPWRSLRSARGGCKDARRRVPMVRVIARKHIATAAKVLVGLGLVYFLLRGVNPAELGKTLARLNVWTFFTAVCCFVAAVALNAVRWTVVLRVLGTRLPLTTTLLGTFEGMFFNLFLPTGVGGDAMRAYRAYDRGATATIAIESALI